ncbi:hypothetical protein CWI39_0775p0020 [Hamiltosporidium magnivora]|uniref:Uncharacterized protein n=1 Tax=Hamiltosporidium magnivora TaxID=148818 RepID=A0A4Q9LAF0_9MICR|nr:hypothetical protein CWI39_0775p0020 [Hamiltosporidium magnivora]
MGREIIFRKVSKPEKTKEEIKPTEALIFAIQSKLVGFNVKKYWNNDDLSAFFEFAYSQDFIKLTIFDIKKFPLNFKDDGVHDTSENIDDLLNVLNIEIFAIKNFELFLSTYYLPQNNMLIKDFLNFIYLFEIIGVCFDDRFAKMIEILTASLLISENFDSFDFKEKIVNLFQIDLLSRVCSLFVFKKLIDFLFTDFKFNDFERFYCLDYLYLPIFIRERFKNRNCNSLHLNEFSLPISFNEAKYTRIQKNIISLILYILNYKVVEIQFSFIKNLPSLFFLLSLSVGSIEDVIFNHCEIENSFIQFLNICSFFKKRRYYTQSNKFSKFGKLTIYEHEILKINTLMCKKVTEILRIAIEMENNVTFPFGTETHSEYSEKEYKINSEKYNQLIPFSENFWEFNIEMMLISNSKINSSILSRILEFNFLKTLNFFNRKIHFDKKDLEVDCNTSIAKFIFRNSKILIPGNFLTFLESMKNLETLILSFYNEAIVPTKNDFNLVPKKMLKNLDIFIDPTIFTSMNLYFIYSFLVTEALILNFKHLREFRNDFSRLVSDNLKQLELR